MIFLQFWWTLMVLTGTTNTLAPQAEPQAGSEQLRSFHNSVNEAHEQLHEIRSNYGDVQGAELYRHRRNSIDDLLASFAHADDKETAPEKDDKELQQAADDWFRDIQAGVVHVLPAAAAGEASGAAGEAGGTAAAAPTAADEDAVGVAAGAVAAGAAEETSALVDSFSGKYSRGTEKLKSRVHEDSYGKAMEQTEVGKVKKKYQDLTDMTLPVKHLPEKQPYEVIRGGATELDIKLKHVQRLLHNQEMEQSRAEDKKNAKANKEPGQEPGQLTQYGDDPVPDGVYEQTLARLQVARVSNPNNLSHEANYKLSKIEQEAAEQSAKTRYPIGILKKRSSATGFNPMNEIKLKTSNRLMRKGMGPSLPSNALTDTLRAHYVDDIIMRRERKLERERQKSQQQQLQQQQLDGEEEKNSPVSSYDTLNALDGSVGSSLDTPNVHLMDTPQSYDYRLPHFEQFPALSQQRSLPNMREYAHANAKLKVERDRFKRHPDQLDQSEAALDADKSNAEQSKDKLPEAEDLMTKLTAPTAVGDKVQAKLDLATGNEAKEEQQAAAVKAETVDPIVEPKPQGHTQVKETATDLQSAEKHLHAVNVNEPKQLQAQAQMQMPDVDQTQPINEAKSQVVDKAQPIGHLAAKQKDDGLQKASNGKLKREESRNVAELVPRSGICKSHPDAVVKLLANKISQHSSDKDRDKRHIKRWSWHRVHRQKANHNANVANETPHYKRRSKRSVDQPPAEPQSEGQSVRQSEGQSESHSEGQSEGLSEPQSAGQSEGQSESHVEGQSEGLSEPQSAGQSEGQSESHSEGQTEALSEPQSAPQLEPEPRSKRHPKLEPQSEAQLKQQASAEVNAQMPEEQSEGQSNSQPQSQAQLDAQLNPQLEPQPRSKRYPKSDAQSYPQLDPQSEAQLEPQLSSLAQSDLQGATKRSSKLLDSFEDHNGNRVGFGSLGNGMLTLETEDDSEGDGLPYPRHQRSSFKKVEAAQEVGTVDSNSFSNSRYQVPMMNQRNNNLLYQQQQQQQLQQQQQQPQTFVPQQQLLPQQLQPGQPQMLHRQQPQQQQLQLQQQQQQANNFKANFNLTHLFNELAKLQKPPVVQQQQELQQQQQQQQQQQPQLHQQQQQFMPQHQQQQQAAASLETNQLKPLYGVHRYFGPLFNKGNKLNVMNDPCVTITTAAATTTTAGGGSTINPECVPISTDATGTTAMPAGEEQQASNPCSSPDAVKLNVSLNARVCSDPRTKQIYGNGSICVQPSQQRLNVDAYYTLQDALVGDNDEDLDSEERYSRQARQRSEEECKDKRKTNGKKSQSSGGKRAEKKKSAAAKKAKAEQAKCSSSSNSNSTSDADGKSIANCSAGSRKLDLNEPYSENYNKLLTGRLSEDIVTAVFETVSNDPSMDPLVTVLTRNNKCAAKHPKNFYQIRNNKNENELQEKEEMLRRTMESISDIIDKQMQKRNCIPLRPDLIEFYNIIMKTMAEQQKSRDKREANLRVLADDYNQQVRILEPANIEQKSRIVKKLLRQYEELPLEEQQHAASVRDELLMDLIYLRKMSDTLERGQRNAQLQNVLRKSSVSDDVANQQAYQDYTPRFIKLLRTAEIFKEVGEQQARAFIGL